MRVGGPKRVCGARRGFRWFAFIHPKLRKHGKTSSCQNVSPRVMSGDVLCVASSTMRVFRNTSSAKPGTHSTLKLSSMLNKNFYTNIIHFCTLTFSVLYALQSAVPNPSLAMFAICSCCHECLVCICVVPLREECTFWKCCTCLFALDIGWTRLLYIVYAVYVAYIRLSRTLPRYTTMCVLPHFIAVITFHCCDYYTYNYADPPPPQIRPYYPLPVVVLVPCLPVTPWCCRPRYLPKLIIYVHFLYSAPAHGQPVSEFKSRCGAQAPLLPCFLFAYVVLRGEDPLNLSHLGPKSLSRTVADLVDELNH